MAESAPAPGKLEEMKYEIRMPDALGKQHPKRRMMMRDVMALAVLLALTLGLFGVTEIYYNLYSRYRSSLGLSTDNSPVIALPQVRRR